eukprot:COSAG05_NODE_6396_length_967_cov_0.927419_2_plen_95_part_00
MFWNLLECRTYPLMRDVYVQVSLGAAAELAAAGLEEWLSDGRLATLVDNFLAVRFPPVLAANKCDAAAALANVQQLREALGSQHTLHPTSARSA